MRCSSGTEKWSPVKLLAAPGSAMRPLRTLNPCSDDNRGWTCSKFSGSVPDRNGDACLIYVLTDINLAIRKVALVAADDVRNPTLQESCLDHAFTVRRTKYCRKLEYAASSNDFFAGFPFPLGWRRE